MGRDVCCLSSCSYIKPQPHPHPLFSLQRCLSSCSYIKPQPIRHMSSDGVSCLSSCSYIKPQPHIIHTYLLQVVYHLVPTSNHNQRIMVDKTERVVYHLVPTSNHNKILLRIPGAKVVYHLVPTSNHNRSIFQCSTAVLFIILFLHQTTTVFNNEKGIECCLSSCSYIKPQRWLGCTLA